MSTDNTFVVEQLGTTCSKIDEYKRCHLLIYYTTNAMPVCVLLYLSSVVILSFYLSMCSGTDISAQVPPISMKVCVTADLSPGQSFSTFGGDIVRGHQMRDQNRESGSVFGSLD